jgi:hypothetical protein
MWFKVNTGFLLGVTSILKAGEGWAGEEQGVQGIPWEELTICE